MEDRTSGLELISSPEIKDNLTLHERSHEVQLPPQLQQDQPNKEPIYIQESHEIITDHLQGEETEEYVSELISPEDVIDINRTSTTVDTLVINVIIKGQPNIDNLTAFVDTGASVSLISAGLYEKLDKSKYPLKETPYKRVSGIGSVLFPVLGGVSICLEFSPNFCTKASDFVIIPDGVTEYNLVIGYDILREEHLLPDPHKGELVSRKGNMVKPVATDIRHSSSIK